MKGDFTRNPVFVREQISRVLMQQGRVLLDSDWNEQNASLLHYLQSLAADLIGPFGGPAGPDLQGFAITPPADGSKNDFAISRGRYYVDGILCEQPHSNLTYLGQYDYPIQKGSAEANALSSQPSLIYLDVWERHITYVEDQKIREVALGGPDTATRAKTVCQVKLQVKSPPNIPFPTKCTDINEKTWPMWRGLLEQPNRGMLVAQLRPDSALSDACNISPGSKYRGAENQLYRVEIHDGGIVGTEAPTFKWSRDNASVVYPILTLNGTEALLSTLGKDDRTCIKVNDWMEIEYDDSVLLGKPGDLLQVASVDWAKMIVSFQTTSSIQFNVDQAQAKHALLRRWNSPAIPIHETASNLPDIAEGQWFDLEDGIQVLFQFDTLRTRQKYRTGDYWLIPARVVTGEIDWPLETALAPHGIIHHYAPLAAFTVGATPPIVDLRRMINSNVMTKCT